MSVALSMIGGGLDRPSTIFLAWFGPRGLASVVFALLAIEELGEGDESTEIAVAAVALTVAASILLHGATAGPGGRRYVHSQQPDTGAGPCARTSGFIRPPPGSQAPVRQGAIPKEGRDDE
jgi:sodium/hydrogen antiporter